VAGCAAAAAEDAVSAGRRIRRALATWAIGAAVLRVTLWGPEICPPLTVAEARAAAVRAGDWIVTNQEDDGSYLYGWHRETDEVDGSYNLVRHAGVTMSLYQLTRAGEHRFLAPADDGLRWMLDRLEPAGEGVAFSDTGQAKLGASALVAVSLAQRRLATGDPRFDATMVDLGHFLVGQQRDDGSMLNFFDLAAQRPVPGLTSVFATGEALWAMALLHEAFPDDGFDEPAWLTLDHLALRRDLEEGFYPQPWPDQWAAYSLDEMAEWGLEDHHVDYARRLLQRYAFLVRFDAQRGTTYGSVTHGPAPRGSGTGTWIEGLGALRALTLADPRLADTAEPTADALACGASRLEHRQVDPGDGVGQREAGAWFYDELTRMDDQQHAASGLLLAEAVLP
jgi:hypothetical protein